MDDDHYYHPTGRIPKLVDVVALGESSRTDYLHAQLTKGPTIAPADETWTVNRGIRAWRADLAFVLDEIEHEAESDPQYGTAIQAFLASGKPIITTRIRGEFLKKGLLVRRFPARLVLDCFQINPEKEDPYWHNSIPMILAYACAIGVRTLRLWGADYTLPDGRVMESDRACCEHWMGRCVQRGLTVALSPNTTLCNRAGSQGQVRVYGLLNQGQSHLRQWMLQGPATLGQPDGVRTVAREGLLIEHQIADGANYCQACGMHRSEANDYECQAG